jgi:hypothetical protein
MSTVVETGSTGNTALMVNGDSLFPDPNGIRWTVWNAAHTAPTFFLIYLKYAHFDAPPENLGYVCRFLRLLKAIIAQIWKLHKRFQ